MRSAGTSFAAAMPASTTPNHGSSGTKSLLRGTRFERPSHSSAGWSKGGPASSGGAASASNAAPARAAAGRRRKARPSTLATAMQCRMPKKMKASGIISQVTRVIAADAATRIARAPQIAVPAHAVARRQDQAHPDEEQEGAGDRAGEQAPPGTFRDVGGGEAEIPQVP